MTMTPESDLSARIEQFIDAYHVMSLATTSGEGPHAANLFYIRDRLSLVWVSDPTTQHSRDLAGNARVAATIAPDVSDYPAVRGVQLTGEARLVTEFTRRTRLLALLICRYNFLARLDAGPEKMKTAFQKAGVYRLTPSRIVLIDNSRGFGHKETLSLTEDPAEDRQ